MLDVLHHLSPGGPIRSVLPKTMESVGQNYGFMLYRTQIPTKFADNVVELEVQGLRDRGTILVGQVCICKSSLRPLVVFVVVAEVISHDL